MDKHPAGFSGSVPSARMAPGARFSTVMVENTESYAAIDENSWQSPRQQPYSTFSVDVDTGSYTNVRRFLTDGELPPTDAVRVEEMINYFDYASAEPENDQPFAAQYEVATCPWQPDHRLVRLALNTQAIDMGERLPTNLVFLIDVSGSMNSPDKLQLVQRGLRLLVSNLGADDRLGIVVYAGESRALLKSKRCTDGNKAKILEAIESLTAGGSTAGGSGIQMAYDMVHENMERSSVNRVLICTDGDFNVGITDHKALVSFIEEKAEGGAFLTVLGFGTGNIKDDTLEQLADKGNGHYAYVDSITEARKVLVEEMGATLVTVAKDVKLQVEFNPARVGAYRLVGYENRMLQAEDFNDDQKDAGEVGAGHSVTALYEIAPPDKAAALLNVDPLRYQQPAELVDAGNELLHLKLRYKAPKAEEGQLLTWTIPDATAEFAQASEDFRFAAAVAAFGMLLRDSDHKGQADYAQVIQHAQDSRGLDEAGYRAEFVTLARNAQALAEALEEFDSEQ
jgi:Ca-activated chloride channel family protein